MEDDDDDEDKFKEQQNNISFFITANCPLSQDTYMALPNELSCTLSDTCTSISCCYNSSLVDRMIHSYIDVDVCNSVMTIGIGHLSYKTSLLEYEFGREESVWLGGVFRIK